MDDTATLSVEVHRSREELFLYLARELDIEYAEAKEYYEREATVISAD